MSCIVNFRIALAVRQNSIEKEMFTVVKDDQKLWMYCYPALKKQD